MLADLTVLAGQTDPYRHDNPRGHKNAAWFKEMIDRFVPAGTVHLRGLHYRISSVSGIGTPLRGLPYINTNEMWVFLSEAASRAARWLGYVPFERLVDERNSAPEIYVLEQSEQRRPFGYMGVGYADLYIPGMTKIVRPQCNTDIHAGCQIPYRQPYRIVLVGEKSSLRDVLLPITEQVQGELLLPNGELSHTMLWDMCARASLDTRPTVVLYFSDFDPAGFHMPTNVARRIQAMRDLHFGDLAIEVHHVALTVEQAVIYDLPSTPLKEGELRAAKWKAKWGREQTEIDALLALHPEALRDIAFEALRPFYDSGLAARAGRMMREWQQSADAIIQAHPLYEVSVEKLEQAQAETETAIEVAANAAEEAISTAETKIQEALDGFEAVRSETERELGNIETPPVEPVEPELAEAPEPVYQSADDWVAATKKLKQRKDLVPDEED